MEQDISVHTTKVLSDIIQDVSSLITVEEIIDKVYERVNDLMDAAVFAIGIHEPDTQRLRYPADIEKGEKLEVNFDSLSDDSRLSVRCFKTRKEIVTDDFIGRYQEFFPGKEVPVPIAGGYTASIIYLPLVIRNRAVGVLTVQSFEKHRYNDFHLDILRGIAATVAGALERAQLYENMEAEVKKRTEQVLKQKQEIESSYRNTKLLSEIGKQITSCLTVEKIIETTYENINRLMDASSFWIGIHNPLTNRLEYPMGKEKGKSISFAFYSLDENERLPVWCFKNQEQVFVNDYLKEYNNYIPGGTAPRPIAGEMPESSIWYPLVAKDRTTLGVITIQSFSKNAYNGYHLSIVRNLAVFTSIALENALLYESVEQKVRERTVEVVKQKEEIEQTYENLKLLSEIGQQITSCLSVEKIIETTYANLNKLMDATIFFIGMHDETQDQLLFPGAIENNEKLPPFHIDLDDNTRLATVCFKKSQDIFINDLPVEFKKYIPDLYAYGSIVGEIPMSLIYLPLIDKQNKKVGVITVQSYEKNAYTPFHLNVIKNLAVFVNIALENALHYEEIEQKVIERTAEVTKQKEQLEEKNKDITDSINYAKRIQEALLPSLEMKEKLFPESFIFFKPRDIVSGDFYWFAEKNGKRLIAAVDCTGHGVPGALMSMIGNSFLSEIVNERALTRPGLILDKLRHLIIRALKQNEETIGANDGMDISLLSFREPEPETGKLKVEWAGANNPLWIMRKGKCLQYNPDKSPISYSHNNTNLYTNHTIELEKGDTLYIFTDGFADQFGGPKGKKFKYKQLQEVLLNIQDQPMESQKQVLTQRFVEWRGNLEQVDDVLVLGVRV